MKNQNKGGASQNDGQMAIEPINNELEKTNKKKNKKTNKKV
uniref:Uncharacterized protein n=1 Tax=viral metagenome TaxID=1070528 RepID=A0A6C0EGX8_9ZZZZ